MLYNRNDVLLLIYIIASIQYIFVLSVSVLQVPWLRHNFRLSLKEGL